MLDLGSWERERWRFQAQRGVPAFSGISGGRTSGMMAALHDDSVTLTFQNTGVEHPKTYDFLAALEKALGRPIVWLEFRPPAERGAPPREFSFAVVDYATASRDGTPFRLMLEAIAEYRRVAKGLGPVSPWARSRICTAYLKHRVQEKYIRSLGHEEWDSFVGLRRDEPHRVVAMRARATSTVSFRMPLDESGINKENVLAFWRNQSFDLEIRENQGNCTGCFLKDQSDLARVLQEEETSAAFWEALGDTFPDFGGQRFPGYRQLRAEGPVRERIQEAFAENRPPLNDGSLTDERFRLVVLQERRRRQGELPAFSCSCEGAEALADSVESRQIEMFP